MTSLEALPQGRSGKSEGDPSDRGDSGVGEDEAGRIEALNCQIRDLLRSGVDDGSLRSHVRDDDVDLVVASNDDDDEDSEDVDVVVVAVDNLVVVVEDGVLGGVGSDLYEGCRQTVQVEVVVRSFLFSSFSNNKKERRRREASVVFQLEVSAVAHPILKIPCASDT